MKKILIIIFGIGLIIFSSFSFSKSKNNGHNGKCTGSAYCGACSNCSRCGHCSAGGTCGVCSGSSSGKKSSSDYSTKRKGSKSHQPNKKYEFQKTPNAFINTDNIVISSRSTNVFEKPSFQSKVIENISKNTQLIQISKLDYWYKIQINKSEKTGYVYYKDVK